MKKTLSIFSILLLFIFGNYLILEKNAVGAIIDFETVPGGIGPLDGQPINTQYPGVEFYLDNGLSPNLEAVGGSDSFAGFWNDIEMAEDIEADGGGLGDYYLRLNARRLQDAPLPLLVIEFSDPISAASAEIWDIDAFPDQGYEQWRVTAFDVDNNFIASVESLPGVFAFLPNGDPNPLSLDGKPWEWRLASENGDISILEIEWTGSKETGIGLAFDNFNTNAVPIPGAVWLFGSGLLGMVFIRRRLKN